MLLIFAMNLFKISYIYKDIIQDSDTVIRKKSVNVELPLNAEDKQLLMDMLQYVRDSQDNELAEQNGLRPAVGIAAIQLGIPKKMLAVVVPDEEGNSQEFALANARIVSESVQLSYLKNGEGCLSVEKEHQGLVPRHARITVKAYDLLQDKEITIKASDYLAIVLQHEIDHFSGTLFYDRINQNDPWHAEKDSIIIE